MISAKEAGFVLSIDQASNLAGAALFKDGRLIGWDVLKSKSPKDSLGTRLVAQTEHLTRFLSAHLKEDDEIKTVLFEGVKSKIVLIVVGAFVTCPYLQNCKIHPRATFVYSMQWKKYMAHLGAKGKIADIKGVPALRDIGWDFDLYPIESDDVADAISIYLTWKARAY